MIVRPYLENDFNEVAMMYRDLIGTVYHNYKLGAPLTFEKAVRFWIEEEHDIHVAVEPSGELCGFTLSFIERSFIIQDLYRVDQLFIKPKFRNSRAALLLYANMIEISKILELPIVAKGWHGSISNKILQKFGTPIFTEYERFF